MNLQYIQDNKGKTTGVYIPIEEWQLLKEKYIGLEEEEQVIFDIPDWYKEVLDERLKCEKKDFIPVQKSLNKIREKHGL